MPIKNEDLINLKFYILQQYVNLLKRQIAINPIKIFYLSKEERELILLFEQVKKER